MRRFLDDMCLSTQHLPSYSVDPIWGKSMAIVTELLTDALNTATWEQQQQHLIARASQIFNSSSTNPNNNNNNSNVSATTTATSTLTTLRNSSSSIVKSEASLKSNVPLEERIETTTRLTLAQTLSELNSVIECSQAEIIQRDAEVRRAQQQLPKGGFGSSSSLGNSMQSLNSARARFNSASAGSNSLQQQHNNNNQSGNNNNNNKDSPGNEKLGRAKSDEKTKRLNRESGTRVRLDVFFFSRCIISLFLLPFLSFLSFFSCSRKRLVSIRATRLSPRCPLQLSLSPHSGRMIGMQ
jgi:hypothetical protein